MCTFTELLKAHPIDIVCLGIGENGHIAFNDPDMADFNDKATVKPVELDDICRQQQVNDACFNSIDEVPFTDGYNTVKDIFCHVHIKDAHRVPAGTSYSLPRKNKGNFRERTAWQNPSDQHPFRRFQPQIYWQTSNRFYGGALLNTGPPPMDQALNFLGIPDEEIPNVFSILRRMNSAGDAEDCAKVILTYPGKPIVDVEVNSTNCYNDWVYKVYAEKGSLVSTMGKIKWKYHSEKEMPKLDLEPLRLEDGVSPAYCDETLNGMNLRKNSSVTHLPLPFTSITPTFTIISPRVKSFLSSRKEFSSRFA